LHVAAEHRGWEAECVYEDGTSLTGLAKELLNCIVIANGKLDNLTLSQRLLDNNEADLLAIGKAALANPDFVKKLIENRERMPFDTKKLFPNPSLLANEKYEGYLQEHEMNVEEKFGASGGPLGHVTPSVTPTVY
jgi:2,4-dienoyl-CoA reductase-like NADH-dependent reductase (Old Yellow Enzyme family)